MNPDDIPRVEDGPMPTNRITVQHLEPPTGLDPIRPRDAFLTGTPQPRDGNAPPAAVLLDFMYGAAAYKRWGNGPEMKRVMHDKFVDEYQSIPILQKPVCPSSGENSGSEPGDPTDGDYVLAFRNNHARRPQDSMIEAMDNMNALMMRMNGITPEVRAAKWQREEEEKQLKDKEVSQSKVLEWRSNLMGE